MREGTKRGSCVRKERDHLSALPDKAYQRQTIALPRVRRSAGLKGERNMRKSNEKAPQEAVTSERSANELDQLKNTTKVRKSSAEGNLTRTGGYA